MPTQIPVETEPAWIAATIAASMYMLLAVATMTGIAVIIVCAYSS